jgi:hypothetical protein
MFMETKALNEQIEVSEIRKDDWKKIKSDLRFIQLVNRFAKDANLRVIISGGYANDGNLGEITRPHNDIDIQVYGNSNSPQEIVENLIQAVTAVDDTYSGLEINDKGRQEYYHSYFIEKEGLGADVYYIQVVGNPNGNEKRVVKSDGTYGEPHEFDANKVLLEGVGFEAENPVSELVDILYKRNIRGDKLKDKHEQDIANLQLITDTDEVERRLSELSKI